MTQTADAPEPGGGGRGPGRAAVAGLAVLILAAGLAARIHAGRHVSAGDGYRIRDNDTLRRLVRLEDLVRDGTPYPFRNPMDGHPEGTVLHWTLPHDAVILGLDALLSPAASPEARRFEAGAVWAGPVLGLLGILLFLILAVRWLGAWPGLLAAALYALSPPVVLAQAFGNGDHQALQHLALVAAVPGFALLVSGRGAAPLALLVGTALGLGLWVSTETMTVLYLLALGALLHLVLVGPAGRGRAVRMHLSWTGACLAVTLVGDRMEHPGAFPAFEWDQVSGFHHLQLGLFGLLLLLCAGMGARWPRARAAPPLAAAAVALLLGIAVLRLTPLAAAVEREAAAFAEANRWAQAAVFEYRPLFHGAGDVHLGLPGKKLSALVYLLPLLAAGAALCRRVPRASRLPFVLVALGLFGLTCLEVKLAHVFAICFPLLVVLGGLHALDVAGRRGLWLPRALPALLAAAAVLCQLPVLPAPWTTGGGDRHVRAATQALAELSDEDAPAGGKRAVLAHWTFAPPILYHARLPVVASGYHRNIDGIHDAYRFLVGTDRGAVEELLRRRRVRWVLVTANPAFLVEVGDVLPELGRYAEVTGSFVRDDGAVVFDFRTLPRVARTLYWYLAHAPSAVHRSRPDPFFRLEWESREAREEILAGGGRARIPLYRIFRVVYPEER